MRITNGTLDPMMSRPDAQAASGDRLDAALAQGAAGVSFSDVTAICETAMPPPG